MGSERDEYSRTFFITWYIYVFFLFSFGFGWLYINIPYRKMLVYRVYREQKCVHILIIGRFVFLFLWFCF